MPRGQKSKEILNSKAEKKNITMFLPQQVSWELDTADKSTTAVFSPYEYFDTWHVGRWSPDGFAKIRQEGFIKDFPIIYQGDGNAWDLGNLYLMHRYMMAAAEKARPNIDTLDKIANHLLLFRRWIEDCQSKGQDIHELFLPDAHHKRITYRYKRYVMQQRGKTIGFSMARGRMSEIATFYRGLGEGQLVPDPLDNAPMKERTVSFQYSDSAGIIRQMSVISTDLHLSGAKDSTNEEGTYINDEGKLHPISETDQTRLLNALVEFDRYHFELMVLFSLFTGARISTVCTLRIKELRDLMNKAEADEEGSVQLKVGLGTRIDTKFGDLGKNYFLKIPSRLLIQLMNYVDSADARIRRQQPKSYYGDTCDNYVFLTEAGTPYVTSKQEMEDRANPVYSSRIALKDQQDYTVSKGQGVRNWIADINSTLRQRYPDFRKFRFHDLRATFGMNYINDALNQGVPRNRARDELQVLMGHKHPNTTEGYLEYHPKQETIHRIRRNHADRLDAYRKQADEHRKVLEVGEGS